MTGRWKRYPEYRDSGVEWMGEVPTGWTPKRVKHICRFQYGNPLPEEDRIVGEVGVFGSNGQVGTHDTSNTLGPCIVVGRKGSHGSLNFSTQPVFAIDTAFFIDRRSTEENLRWLFYALTASRLDDDSRDAAVPGLSREYAYNKWSIVPPPDEQIAVARFLDRETQRIDALITKKEDVLRLLEARRAAVVHHSVCRGLVSGVEQKDSGAPSIGLIPAHWSTRRIKYVMSKIVDCPHSTPRYCDGGDYFVIRTADMTMGRLHPEAMYRLDEEEYLDRIQRESLIEGDIVYGREGERFGLAAMVPSSPVMCLGQRMMQFRPLHKDDAGYLMWALNCYATLSQAQVETFGSTSPHVNVGTIRNFTVPWPPPDERVAISCFIEHQTASIDTMAAALTASVTKLREYRQSLITAAVTGQIDVRDEVPA